MGVLSCGTTLIDQGLFENIGSITWNTTAKTSNFTATSGSGFFVNTTSGSIPILVLKFKDKLQILILKVKVVLLY